MIDEDIKKVDENIRKVEKKIKIVSDVLGKMILAGVIASIFGGFSITFLTVREKPVMNQRIQEVETAIKSINDLEKYLKTVKEDMIATQRAKETIEQEYAKVKPLQEMTYGELERVRLAINQKSKAEQYLEFFGVFFMGYFTNIVSSWSWDKYKEYKRKKKDLA